MDDPNATPISFASENGFGAVTFESYVNGICDVTYRGKTYDETTACWREEEEGVKVVGGGKVGKIDYMRDVDT